MSISLTSGIGYYGGTSSAEPSFPQIPVVPLPATSLSDAWDTQLVVSGYSGPLLRVIKPDFTTLDIYPQPGFANPDWDAVFYELGVVVAPVDIFYSQTGSGRHLTQTVSGNRPVIHRDFIANGRCPILLNGVNRGTTSTIFFDVPVGVSMDQQNTSLFITMASQIGYEQMVLFESGGASPIAFYTNGTASLGSNLGLSVAGGGTFSAVPNIYLPQSEPCVRGFQLGASAVTAWSNTSSSPLTGLPSGTKTGGYFGQTPGGGTAYNSMYAFFGAAHYTSGSVSGSAIAGSMVTAHAVDTTANRVLIFDGHSANEGYGCTYLRHLPFYTQQDLTTAARVYDTAVFGRNLVDTLAAYSTIVAPLYDGAAAANVVFVADAAIDLETQTAATCITRLQNYCSAARSTGYKVVVSTVKPRGDANANFIAQQPTFNSTLISTWATFADGLIDISANPLIGGTGTGGGVCSNTVYWNADTVHLNSAGFEVYNTMAAPVINGLL